MKALVLSSSPRRDGNSFQMAEAAMRGLEETGIESELVHLSDYIKYFLPDCRSHKKVDGECVFDDDYRELFVEKFLPADGVIFATPLYWYSMSAQLKAFFDRTFSYLTASNPKSETYIKQFCGKRLGLLISSEESYPMAPMGIIQPIQEFSRYTHSYFTGYVQGTGNRRGDIQDDPANPLEQSYLHGKTLFTKHVSDYQIDTQRSQSVWNRDEPK